ncbi:MAG: chorismate synthase [Clostridia bacterium]|nr:chorismate synthase [Clostridia bacterium]
MKNVFGNSITVTLFGESHGDMIGAVIDGLAPGIAIDFSYIDKRLALRRPVGNISTPRREPDKYRIVSGAYEGYTTGTPLTVLIENTSTKSADYRELSKKPRPSHADYTAEVKYHGFQDARGGGHFSGRITAALVAVGAILSSALERKGIKIATHICALGGIFDRPFGDYSADADILENTHFPVLSDESRISMTKIIEEAAKDGDSIGGVLETAVIGVPAGLGEPWFDSVESRLSHIVFSVPGIKGVEFGSGFGFADMRGSEANDAFRTLDGKVVTATNHNGGINGGITNGMPIIMRSAVKPTPSIYKEQDTVDLEKMENATIKITGRHDPAIIHRARAVIDAVVAIAIADMIAERYGTDALADGSVL